MVNFKRPLNLEDDDNPYDDNEDEDVYLPLSVSLEEDDGPYDDDEDGESVAALHICSRCCREFSCSTCRRQLPSIIVKARNTNSA